MTKFMAGQKYKLKAVVVNSDGSRFEPGELFTFDPDQHTEYKGVFVSDYDGAMISRAVANKFERQSHKPMFVEAK